MTLHSLLKTAAAGVMALAVAAPAKADWGGLYIGVSAGWAGLSEIDWTYVNQTQPQLGDSDNFIAGGHIGIQHQWGQIVVGLEASYSGTLADRENSTGACPNPAFSCEAALRAVFTVGGRLGFAPSHQWLIYVSGGYASAWIDTATFNVATGNQFDKTSARHEGWYVGGGLDWALHGNWLLGVEYQHLFLDSDTHVAQLASEWRRIDADADIVRVRLSYKWGRPEAAPLK